MFVNVVSNIIIRKIVIIGSHGICISIFRSGYFLMTASIFIFQNRIREMIVFLLGQIVLILYKDKNRVTHILSPTEIKVKPQYLSNIKHMNYDKCSSTSSEPADIVILANSRCAENDEC